MSPVLAIYLCLTRNKRTIIAAMSLLIHMFSLFIVLIGFPALFCSARDTITFNDPLRDQEAETLVSGKYELGFFTPNGRSDNKRYLGIWYYKSRPRTVVWVANRDEPLEDSTGVFALSKDGNLRVLDMQNKSYWSTPLTGRPFVNSFPYRTTVRLMDTGNLVLREEDPKNNVSVITHWKSFDYPSDTFLPGMKMNEDLVLSSWVSNDDPGHGDFTFQKDEGESQYNIRKKTVRYWQNKVSGSFIDSSDDEANLTILLSPQDYDWRLVMNFTGQIQIYMGDDLHWWAPRSPCSVYNLCGNFGSCNDGTQSLCKCLPGFEPKSLHKWNSRDFWEGCTRKSSGHTKNDVFLSLKKMKVSKPDEHFRTNNETDCKMACLENENCHGYSYEFRDTGRCNCWIWSEELKNLWENYTSGGRDIQVRVAVSDIESTRRSCETCGTNIIPYPLSTEPSCGDIRYWSFNCSNDTGQLSFQTYTGFYSVANIKPENRTFSVLVQNCTDVESANRLLQLNHSSMFYVSRGCNDVWNQPKLDGFLEDNDFKEVEIAWMLPPEPICYASKDCIDWPHSSCRASGNGKKCQCQCNEFFHWEPSLLNCTAGHATKEKLLFLIPVGITATALIISGVVFSLYFLRRRRIEHLRESRRRIQGNQAFRLYDSVKRVKDLILSEEFLEEDRKDIDAGSMGMRNTNKKRTSVSR
ncbi:serine/threonine-protein kinase [Tripterygium wilfordii]|uniref:non-specific serine/threonine protein kinase n=1 Tax=Tripterygium wilfordii TaxID=458696 RepID=A0A7J7BX31_TRIWF|nr:serine/threonine-protein kinase [Tripterygium wilfordii]